MLFYSHKYKDKPQKNKLLKDHLSKVSDYIRNNVYPHIFFPNLVDVAKVIETVGCFHDLGKYTSYFQDYLDDIFKGAEKKHAFISAVAAFNYLTENKLTDYEKYLVYFVIKNHHLNLSYLKDDIWFDEFKIVEQQNLITKQANDLKKNFLNIKGDFPQSLKEEYLAINNEMQTIIRKMVKRITQKDVNIANYFCFNYFFSILIESDKLNASNTECYQLQQIPPDIITNYINNKFRAESKNNNRNEARIEIENNVDDIKLDMEKIFSITAPTGIGKTLASINFSIKLKYRIVKEKGYIPQIIYCLPFINIIEQVEKEFTNILSDTNLKIIKHHSFTDIFSLAKQDESSNYNYENYKMLVETWQGDFVLTSFVQLLHTLIGNKNRLLKKFHHLAGSIIILDEVQSLDCKYWPLIGAALYNLTKYLDAKIILMTATQPYLFENLDKVGISNVITPRELLQNNAKYFRELKRTKIIPNFKTKLQTTDEFISFFKDVYQDNKSCLIVLNTINRSKEVYEKVKENYKKTKQSIFYLSTSLIPKQRLLVIRKVKKLLKAKKPVILISTQSIEAGVDLDFDMGIRDIGPIDSIIQVAGRINRENDEDKGSHCPLYVVYFIDDSINVYGQILVKTALETLDDQTEIFEEKYPGFIKKYFSLLSQRISQNTEIFEAMKVLDYTTNNDKCGIDSFKLIETKDEMVDVFIDWYNGENSEESILQRYLTAIESKNKENTLKLNRHFKQYIISCKKKYISSLPENYRIYENLYYIPNELFKDYYKKDTGFIGKDISILIF
ncbi:MAG: CRISPR-associated helicase Cas3' [Candidatus Delongbacteria bacterium]|nr:CRISPR-associated helicase Cas3' [Candidatus Delongbacteria bacterium]